MLREQELDAWGCDVFYEGGDSSSQIPVELRPYIRRMAGDANPYDDVSFDVVLSNQVFEHVPDMEAALIEIARVLKPAACRSICSLIAESGARAIVVFRSYTGFRRTQNRASTTPH